MKDICHPSHRTRFSFDASSYDEICMDCGFTDEIGGWGKLALPCPMSEQAAWRDYAGDFNAMSDIEIERESARAMALIEEEESWLEAVASWEKAGRPRNLYE